MAIVVVEREFPESMNLDEYKHFTDEAKWCFETQNVTKVATFVGADGKRVVCVYDAPDVDAVRRANETARAPYTAMWSATVHDAE